MMGSSFSKKPNSPSQGGGSSSNSRSNHSSTNSDVNGSSNGSSSNQYIRELSSYQSDPDQDPDLESFDSALQHRTIGAISMLAGSEINSISFNTLMEVTGCLLDNNQEVVNMILEYKKDVWKNPELFDIVQEFFDCSLRTLDFCTALEKCLKRARDSQLIIHIALKHSEEDEEGGGEDKYKRTLDELQRFKNIGNPFTAEFFQAFQSVYSQQVSMFEKLKKNKRKLDKKLKSVKAWRRVSNIIFVSAFAAVLICSVVSAVMAAPAVAAALAAAAAIPLGSVGKWVDSLWKDYSKVLKGQKDVLNIMQAGTFVAISDLDSIRALVERLEIHIGSLMQNVDIVLGDEEAVKFGIEEIKKKMEEFMRGVESLGKQVDRCSRDIQRARTVVLQRIIRHPE